MLTASLNALVGHACSMPTHAHFEPTDDETWLIDLVKSGMTADGSTKTGDRPVIRAHVLRDLLLDTKRPCGVRVANITVTGELDLSHAVLTGPIALTDCIFDAPVDLTKAHVDDLDLSGADAPSIGCKQIRVDHDIVLRRAKTTSVNMRDAGIGGRLDLSGGTFTNPGGIALSADGAQITGDMFCGEGFHAEGAVRLPGAGIGGQLALTGGTCRRSRNSLARC